MTCSISYVSNPGVNMIKYSFSLRQILKKKKKLGGRLDLCSLGSERINKSLISNESTMYEE